MGNSLSLHNKRKKRNRIALKKNSYGKLRLSVFRSGRHIYGQIIDDVNGVTITAASSLESSVKKQFKNCGTKEVATVVGRLIAEKAIKKGIKNVVFDRGGYVYHGRVKNLADAARDAGLIF
jgi:ribosomal protein L18, bacterial type